MSSAVRWVSWKRSPCHPFHLPPPPPSFLREDRCEGWNSHRLNEEWNLHTSMGEDREEPGSLSLTTEPSPDLLRNSQRDCHAINVIHIGQPDKIRYWCKQPTQYTSIYTLKFGTKVFFMWKEEVYCRRATESMKNDVFLVPYCLSQYKQDAYIEDAIFKSCLELGFEGKKNYVPTFRWVAS